MERTCTLARDVSDTQFAHQYKKLFCYSTHSTMLDWMWYISFHFETSTHCVQVSFTRNTYKFTLIGINEYCIEYSLFHVNFININHNNFLQHNNIILYNQYYYYRIFVIHVIKAQSCKEMRENSIFKRKWFSRSCIMLEKDKKF